MQFCKACELGDEDGGEWRQWTYDGLGAGRRIGESEGELRDGKRAGAHGDSKLEGRMSTRQERSETRTCLVLFRVLEKLADIVSGEDTSLCAERRER